MARIHSAPGPLSQELIKAALPTLGRHLHPTLVMEFIVVLFVLIVRVLSKTMTVNTTSGQLLGSQADGGMCYLLLLLSSSSK